MDIQSKTRMIAMLKAQRSPTFRLKNAAINMQFSRCSASAIECAEKLSDVELVRTWRGLAWTLYVYGQSSVSDLQLENILWTEIRSREQILSGVLSNWLQDQQNNFDPEAFNKALEKIAE